VASSSQQYVAVAAYGNDYLVNATGGLVNLGGAMNSKVEDPAQIFAAAKTEQAKFLACTGSSGTYNGTTCSNQTLMQRVADMRQNAVNAYGNAVQQAQNQATSVQASFQPMLSFYQNFRIAMLTVAGLWVSVQSAISSGGKGNLAYDSSYDANLNPFPSMQSASQFQSSVGTTDSMNALAGSSGSSFVGGTAGGQASLQTQSDAIRTGQTSWQQGFYGDYNPPPYNVTQQQQAWQQTTDAYLPEMQSNLALVATSVPPAPPATSYQPSDDTTSSQAQATDLLKEQAPRTFSPYFYDLSITIMLGQWLHINNLALIMDYTYRAMRSITIIYSYWKISEVMAPPADVRVGKVAKGWVARVAAARAGGGGG
jgi:hypothetical protein